ncbi:MAG: MBL fold metallo-hydrolase, partial [Candidatus Promineifilaceae bacterium]|nr:MBL fold metallo-hydrolase [Candidatus Promineifilaceae bacterium]
MKLTFLGTRGNIEARTRRHRMHTSLMVGYYGRQIMIDCGEDWLGEVDDLRPEAIVITHAHPDHAWGLKQGAPCPIHATAVAWEEMERYPVDERREVTPRTPFTVADVTFEFFPVEHSTRAPAGGYRITAGRVTIFYVPDVVYIPDRAQALAGAKVYVGDGA